MSQEQQPLEHIEMHGNQRFKLIGKHIVAVEQTCFSCHQTYWTSVISYSSNTSQMGNIHQCKPSPQAGASVIDKFG